jgi:hypothetical protein
MRRDTAARVRADEAAVIETEISKTEAALARYMAAFEKGTISDESFAGRVRDLQAKATTLRHRRDQLATQPEDVDAPVPTIGQLRTVRDDLRTAFRRQGVRAEAGGAGVHPQAQGGRRQPGHSAVVQASGLPAGPVKRAAGRGRFPYSGA